MRRLLSFTFIISGLLMLTACATQAPSSYYSSPQKSAFGANTYQPYSSSTYSYTIRRGDTLYSIAKRYGTTVSNISRTNGIYPPYTIYPGQRIQINVSSTPSFR